MLSIDQFTQRKGQPVYSSDGEKIGDLQDVYIEDASGQPAFLSVSSGFLGTGNTVVPTEGAAAHEDGIRVAYPKDRIKDAPDVDDERIDRGELDEIYEYYGLRSLAGSRTEGSDSPAQAPQRPASTGHEATGGAGYGRERGESGGDGRPGMEGRAATEGRMGPRGSEAPAGSGTEAREGVTLHEEELEVGKRREQRGTARIRKYVESTPVAEDVELERETAHIEREPVNRPVRDAEFREEEVEVPLEEERPVAHKETMATERVSLEKDTERHREQVSDEVRRERAEIDEPDADRR